MRSIGSWFLVALIAAIHWPAAPLCTSTRTSSAGAAASCCEASSCCRHVHAGVPGDAALCSGRCHSDPARVVQGDHDPWVFDASGDGAGPPAAEEFRPIGGAMPPSHAAPPAVPPPRV